MKEEVEQKKDQLKRQLRYVTREDEKEQLLEELRERTEEMQRLVREEQTNQKEQLKARLKERRAKKKQLAAKVRERQELEQLERTAENVRRESEKQRALDFEEIEQVLMKLVKKMGDQQEMRAMGVTVKEREVAVEDIIEVFDKLTAQKMLEELSVMLAKHYNSKEQALNSELRLQMESKLGESEEFRVERDEALEELEAQAEKEGWSQATHKERRDALLLELGAKAREKQAASANVMKERETGMMKEMEREHADELVDLREKQIRAKLLVFKKVLGPLGVERSGLEEELAA